MSYRFHLATALRRSQRRMQPVLYWERPDARGVVKSACPPGPYQILKREAG